MIVRIALLAALAATVQGVGVNARAQVRVTVVATGDVGSHAGMCDAAGGIDSLTGTLALQGLDEDGSAFYAGKLARVTQVDACGTKPNPTEDQVALCVAHLSGSGAMDVTLEVYEGDRGAWFKSKPVATPLPSEVPRKSISGCAEPSEYLREYPNDGWMSGLELADVPSGVLHPGTYTTGTVTLTVQ